MQATIIVSHLPVDATQRGHLQTLFASPGFSLLKEMVVARCIENQVKAMNARLYPNNQSASEQAVEMEKRAASLTATLDLLDDLSSNMDEWRTIKLENSR